MQVGSVYELQQLELILMLRQGLSLYVRYSQKHGLNTATVFVMLTWDMHARSSRKIAEA